MAFQDSSPEDIRATLAVSQEDARRGSSRAINLPGGRTMNVTVPAGVRDGEEIRLPGLGGESASGGAAGDLILHVSVIAMEHLNADLDESSATHIGHVVPPAPPSSFQPYTDYAPDAARYAAPPQEAYAPGVSVPSQVPVYPAPAGGPQSYPGFNAYPNYPASALPGQMYAPQTSMAYPPQPLPQQPRRRGGAITAIILLVVLLLLLGSGLFYYFGYYQPNQSHIAQTATALTQLTGTANSQATGTALVGQATISANQTSTAQVSATAQTYINLYTQATSGTPVLNDALNSQSGSQWDESSATSGSCSFTGGGYQSSMPNATYFQPCYAENTNFGNFAFQIDMAITQGDDGGIIFRADNVNNKIYLFRINTAGNYDLYLYVSNQASQAQRIMTGNASSMRGSGQRNELTLLAQGGSLTFYLNQQYMNSANDATYASGKIGVFSESVSQATSVMFSNAKVWTL
jgi:hypothetical protein